MLTLYTTPVVYLYMDRLSRWLTTRRIARAALQGIATTQSVVEQSPMS
jgi:hypothetical protein